MEFNNKRVMWYRFSKPYWRYDIVDGIEETYAYVRANSKEEAIEKCNKSQIPKRKYDMRGMDIIDEVMFIPVTDADKMIL